MATRLRPVVELVCPRAEPCLSMAPCVQCRGARAALQTPFGPLCASCWRRREQAAALRRRDLAEAYGLQSEKTLIKSLIDERGMITWLPSGGPLPRLRYSTVPERCAEWITDEELKYQPRTLARALWGVALHLGVRLEGSFPRYAFYPEEIPHPVVMWATEDRGRWGWLLRYGRALQDRYIARFGRGHNSLLDVLPWCRERAHDSALGWLPFPDRARIDGRPAPWDVVLTSAPPVEPSPEERPAAEAVAAAQNAA